MRYLCAFVLWVLGVTSAIAKPPVDVYGDGSYGLAGCGLGSLLFGNKPGAVQIVAATFNSTSGNQTFGITTGTSNCGKGIFQAEQRAFIDNNLASLMRESAQGGGETLAAYATTLGCSPSFFQGFYSHMQDNHATIFATNDAANILDNTVATLSDASFTEGQCTKI